MIIPTAEPFFFPGKPGAPGCLLTHGFTGTPKEMRWLGEYLADQGFSVLGPRLSGHATQPVDMIRSRYPDWMASVADGYHLLRGASPSSITLIGLSMGGVLSLLMASKLDVQGVLAMAAPAHLPNRHNHEVWLFKLLSKVMSYQPKSKTPPGSDWVDRQAWADHVSYPRNPVRSAAELKLLITEMHAALPQVRVPALLIYSRDDRTVHFDSMDAIYDELGSTDKRKMPIEGTGHVITRDAKRHQVFEAAAEFVRRIDSQ